MLGDRWSLIVIRDGMFGNRRHFGDLVRFSEEGIASNILASRLGRLVDAGLLQFTALPKHPYNSSRCWLIWVLGGGGTLGPPGNYRFEHSFLKRVANECGRPS
jgi:hypothetical protein